MEDMQRKSWNQMEGEPDLWYGRFMIYAKMGYKRSVNAVFEKERKGKKVNPSTKINAEWYDAYNQWKWSERARSYDEYQRAEEDRIIAEERDKVLRSGFALQHKRIEVLDKLSRKLIAMANDDEKVWIAKTKTTSFGEDKSQVIEEITFNAPLFTLIDKYQDSIAKEMGERVKKQELTGKDGGSMEFEIELVGNRPEEEESEG